MKKTILSLMLITASLNAHKVSFGVQTDGNDVDLLCQLRLECTNFEDSFMDALSSLQPMTDRDWRDSVIQYVGALPQDIRDDFICLCSRMLADIEMLVATDKPEKEPLELVEGCVAGLDNAIFALEECRGILLQFDELVTIEPMINWILYDTCAVLLYHYSNDVHERKNKNGNMKQCGSSADTLSRFITCLQFIANL